MKFNETKIKGLYTAELNPIRDHRGFFSRLYCDEAIKEAGIKKPVKQINHSLTPEPGSIRGLHYQLPPFAEAKIVRCVYGEIFDVAVDLRRDSDTFLQWHGEFLSADNFKLMIIPEGCAHGFQVIKKDSEIFYLSTESYNKDVELGIMFNDKKIGIEWPLQAVNISDRDSKHGPIGENFKGLVLGKE
jgi:dTDP-4-dehydrorhamnose 3,5-epimerase